MTLSDFLAKLLFVKVPEELTLKVTKQFPSPTTAAKFIFDGGIFANYKKVTDPDVVTVFNQILVQQQAIYANFQKMLTRAQWNVFRAIAKEEPLQNPLSKDFLQKHNLGAASTVSTALKALEKLELVVKDEGNYLVHEVQLARWMARL